MGCTLGPCEVGSGGHLGIWDTPLPCTSYKIEIKTYHNVCRTTNAHPWKELTPVHLKQWSYTVSLVVRE